MISFNPKCIRTDPTNVQEYEHSRLLLSFFSNATSLSVLESKTGGGGGGEVLEFWPKKSIKTNNQFENL